jgi:demethylmenaquinone methyltransferase/2-methoxy-6-polyprenyl-1,4-benzoquinol methylase
MVYKAKAAYFDQNVGAPWAAAEYGPDEMVRLERLFQHTGPLRGLKILEPGCGTGRLTEILSDLAGDKGSVVALDISPGMIDVARRRIATRRNVEIHLCAVEELPLEENRYDLILCHQVFPHFEDKRQVLSILARTLNPDGRLIVIHFINFDEINDLHRKAGTAVASDITPGEEEMRRLFDGVGLDIAFIVDDHLGYFLSASRKR